MNFKTYKRIACLTGPAIFAAVYLFGSPDTFLGGLFYVN